MEWLLLISARRLVMLYISTKFCEIISNGIKIIERTRFLYWKLQRGIIPQKNVGGVTVVNLCTSSGHALYFYQVLWNYLERYQSYRADTISVLKISKGNNSAKNVGGVTILISARRLIMLYICAKFREIISNGIKVMERTRMMNRWRTDGRTDGQTLKSSEGIT